MSGEKEFATKGNVVAHGDSQSDPDEDTVDWISEYNRLCRLFRERWETPGMCQLTAAISAVAFEGQDPSTIQAGGGDDSERAQVELENDEALMVFGTFIPGDDRKY